MRHLIITLPRDMDYGLSKDEWERIEADIKDRVDKWRRDGGALLLGHGVTIELIDLTAIAPGHRVCCL